MLHARTGPIPPGLGVLTLAPPHVPVPAHNFGHVATPPPRSLSLPAAPMRGLFIILSWRSFATLGVTFKQCERHWRSFREPPPQGVRWPSDRTVRGGLETQFH